MLASIYKDKYYVQQHNINLKSPNFCPQTHTFYSK